MAGNLEHHDIRLDNLNGVQWDEATKHAKDARRVKVAQQVKADQQDEIAQ